MKTKRKITKRKMLSVMLSVALLISMLPLSGGKVAKAADGYPVEYEVRQDKEGNDYVAILDMASNSADFIEDDTFTFPGEIEGMPVKEIDEWAMLYLDAAKKVVLAASIDTFGDFSELDLDKSTQEVHIMCGSIFNSTNTTGIISFDTKNGTLDIYFYPIDISCDVGCILPLSSSWGSGAKVTMHVSSQTVFDKINADDKAKKEIDAGRLIVEKDLTVSGDASVKAKQDLLAARISQGKEMTEGDYTKGSWSALTAALKTAEENVASSDETVLDDAIAALDDALEGMVSLTALKAAIAAAEGLDEEEYTASSWASFQEAIAAAKAVPDDATAEKVEELRNAITQAQKNLRKKGSAGLELSWPGEDSGPIMPVPKTNHRGSGEITIGYYKDEACNTEHDAKYVTQHKSQHDTKHDTQCKTKHRAPHDAKHKPRHRAKHKAWRGQPEWERHRTGKRDRVHRWEANI